MYDVPVYKVYPNATWRAYEKHADVVHQLALEFVQKVRFSMIATAVYIVVIHLLYWKCRCTINPWFSTKL